MSVLTKVEAKSFKGILFRTFVFITLVIGGTTMIYPFLLMFAGSTRSEMDGSDMGIVPEYFVNENTLVRKFLETKYNYDVTMMNRLRGYQDYSFELAVLPDDINEQRIADFRAFAAETEFPNHWRVLGGTEYYRRIASKNLSRFIKRLKVRYEGDLRALGLDLGSPLRRWRGVSLRLPEWTNPRYAYRDTPFMDEYFKLLHDRPLAERAFVSLSGAFRQNVIFPKYGKASVDEYNSTHTIDIEDFREIQLPEMVPSADQPEFRAEWETFARDTVNASFVRTRADAEQYQTFLKDLYGDVATLNERWDGVEYAAFEDVPLPADTAWIPDSQRQEWGDFLDTQPLESLYLVGPEFIWRDWLQEKYSSLDAAAQAHGRTYAGWTNIDMPLPELEVAFVKENTGELRRQFALRNFANVFDEVLLQGRPLINTLVYVVLSLLLCLTLMPLAAYALSRFNPPGTWRFILIFMATMAFPPMVGMIPQFLILRKLSLLNTFPALVLPIIVNGYLIFLLKGFFDSLPSHLYDAALIDGASELRMFAEITMALSKPILAVVALRTFNRAWISFMYPLLVCPREDMHVLAVWLHQFQQAAPTSAVFASILVTSIPSLCIFLFAQRTIMRGIAVPAEK